MNMKVRKSTSRYGLLYKCESSTLRGQPAHQLYAHFQTDLILYDSTLSLTKNRTKTGFTWNATKREPGGVENVGITTNRFDMNSTLSSRFLSLIQHQLLN